MEGEHLKAKLLENFRIGHNGVNKLLNLLFGNIVHTAPPALLLLLAEQLHRVAGHHRPAASVLGGSVLSRAAGHIVPGKGAHGLGNGDGLIVTDGVNGLTEVVVGAGFGNVYRRIMGRKAHGDFSGPYRRAAGPFLGAHGKVQIYGGGTVFRPVGQVRNQPVGGIFLGALEHMGNAGGGHHAVFQQHIAHLNGREQQLIAIGHIKTLLGMLSCF